MRRPDSKSSPAVAACCLLAALTLLGCTVHTVVPARPVRARVVVLPAGHVHTVRCGHYRHAGRWYYLPGHVHGPGCGHRLVAGVWVLG